MELTARLQREITHGKQIADSAGEIWNWEGAAGLRRWNRRVGLLTRELDEGTSVFEVGCGTGYFTKEIAKTGADIVAMDISPDLLKLAKERVSMGNVQFREGNAYETGLKAASFDFVLGCSVLHHLEVDKALVEFRRLLKPEGILKFSEPNFLNPQIAIQKTVPFVKKWAGDSPDETAFFRWGLAKKLSAAGFKEIRITPFDFLHPAVPAPFVKFFEKLSFNIERIPCLKEIAGSLYVVAKKS